ncbi:unnamed protein product [Miscanthus lutarioriparius]|uniref:Uncharacterized protein n=1 Tax=Miscanthus lutarioriparius TaxID=422564 RepID=A0A811PRB3_9POAL|nr:unnamed protein product [Miscanthus lutarioriparius]
MKTAALLVLMLLALSSAAGATGGRHHPLPSSEALDSATFLSPPFFLRPGSVANKYYHDIAFSRGNIAGFKGEVVDERGAPVPLHETYLRHWVVRSYYYAAENATARPATILARNAGVCEGDTHTATWLPDPYAVEAGDPAAPPEGYVERWMLNVHAIDTRGTVDKVACTECRYIHIGACSFAFDLHNWVFWHSDGRGIPGDYAGGLRCSYDQTRCKVEEGFAGGGEARKLFFRYTVVWLDWSDVAAAAAVVPVRIYIFDVTHRAMPVGCMVEYDVEECSATEKRAKSDCARAREGDQAGAAAWRRPRDGRLLCKSTPIYGGGVEAGDEAGYVVGMTTCYPKLGTVRVRDGEVLTVVSNYSSERRHTGVMGLFAVLVADRPEQQPAAPSSSVSSNLL